MMKWNDGGRKKGLELSSNAATTTAAAAAASAALTVPVCGSGLTMFALHECGQDERRNLMICASLLSKYAPTHDLPLSSSPNNSAVEHS